MAPKLPARYQPQVRLGRDGDVEEWLATDAALDRPVLVRVLAADADRDRKAHFLEAARGAARVLHSHLAQVYAVGNHDSTPHAVLEWTGGVSIEDRLHAGDGIPAEEFLANAAGLADGLAALHAAGLTHGAIDTGAIQFSASHPAKLGGFGRVAKTDDVAIDTAALASTLRAAVTGTHAPSVKPSQVVDGVPPDVDAALDAAEAGRLDAAGLASTLHAIPAGPQPSHSGGWSWGWVFPAGVLVAAALFLAILGLSIDSDPDSPFLFPATPSPVQDPPAITTTTTLPPTTSPVTTPPPGDPGELAATPTVYDPFGDGTERDGDLPNLVDGDAGTTWRTERYFSSLVLIGKPGVGVSFSVDGDPRTMAFSASAGSRFVIRWAPVVPDDDAAWEEVAAGTALGAPLELQLPPRTGGVWLLWLVDLPEQSDDEWYTEIGEVTFRP